MLPCHDMICDTCGHIERDVPLNPSACVTHVPCGTRMVILWTNGTNHHASVRASQRSVVWYNPKTGRHRTPGRNDVPIPDRYAKLGYERKEFTTLHDLDAYCKRENLVNEAAHYNKGSGRAYDDLSHDDTFPSIKD